MSNANSSSHASSENQEVHESPIRTPQQLIVVVVLAFVIPIIVIVLLTKYVGASVKVGAGSDALTPQAIAERIAPIGRVATEPEAGAVVAAAVAADLSGFVTGFALSFLLRPGGWARLLAKLRQR